MRVRVAYVKKLLYFCEVFFIKTKKCLILNIIYFIVLLV